jgi:YHS domain-containing protein
MKVIALFVLAAALAVAVVGCEMRSTRAPESSSSTAAVKAKDPVCGMMVDRSTARSETFKGTTYYFCSQECQDKFDRSPDKYAP